MKNQKRYRAFSVLEVIVSIVILGIVLSAFPGLFRASISANKLNISQEIFFEEVSILNLITTRYFDENNTKDDNYYKEVNATKGDSELLISDSNVYTSIARIGKVNLNNNILRSGTSDTTSAIGLDDDENLDDTSTLDDVDDFNGSVFDFLGKKIVVDVKYIDDSATYSDQNITDFSYRYDSEVENSNLKLITIKAIMGDYNITLRYPVANIGASKYLSLEEISR